METEQGSNKLLILMAILTIMVIGYAVFYYLWLV